MPTLPTTTAAFASTATEAEFKTFLNDFRNFVASMLGTTGLPADAIVGGVPSGTLMLFAQAAAPTGWTKQTTHNDKALRVVSGTGGGSGGVQAFSTVFGRTASDASSLSIAQLAQHGHELTSNWSGGGSSTNTRDKFTSETAVIGSRSTVSTGSGATHSHGLDIRVQYLDVIICTKN
jgi:hypothetical protein